MKGRKSRSTDGAVGHWAALGGGKKNNKINKKHKRERDILPEGWSHRRRGAGKRKKVI
jgi:hypothetical protein